MTTQIAAEVAASIPPSDEVLHTAVVDNELLRVIYVNVPSGEKIEQHTVPGPVVLTMITGKLRLELVDGEGEESSSVLEACDVVYLAPGQVNALVGVENSSFTLTQIKAMISNEAGGDSGCGGGGCGCGGGGCN